MRTAIRFRGRGQGEKSARRDLSGPVNTDALVSNVWSKALIHTSWGKSLVSLCKRCAFAPSRRKPSCFASGYLFDIDCRFEIAQQIQNLPEVDATR